MGEEEKTKKDFDLFDYTLCVAFVGITGTICYLLGTGQEVPEIALGIFGVLATALGFKKTPTTLSK